MLRVLEILDYHIPQPLRTPINPEDDISPLKDRLRTALEWSFMTGERLPHLSADDLDAAWKVQAGLPDAPDLAPLPDSPIAHEATSSSIPIVGAIRRTKVIITLTYTLYLPILKRVSSGSPHATSGILTALYHSSWSFTVTLSEPSPETLRRRTGVGSSRSSTWTPHTPQMMVDCQTY